MRMLNINQLFFQKISEKINHQTNRTFNGLMKIQPSLGRFLAFFFILFKCLLHTAAIFANTLEYGIRGFLSFFSSGYSSEYFSTLGSFLVINTVNALTLIPDIFIRTYYAIQDSKIDPHQTQHTLYYKLMKLL